VFVDSTIAFLCPPIAPRKPNMAEFNLLTASASELQFLLSSGKITSVELVNKCLAQIGKYDHHGPQLRAMIFLTKKEKLFEIAASLDEERKSGNLRGPLHGIPYVLKDMWQTHPDYGMPTTAGMSALLEAKNKDSAVLVMKVFRQSPTP
jgi:amidase